MGRLSRRAAAGVFRHQERGSSRRLGAACSARRNLRAMHRAGDRRSARIGRDDLNGGGSQREFSDDRGARANLRRTRDRPRHRYTDVGPNADHGLASANGGRRGDRHRMQRRWADSTATVRVRGGSSNVSRSSATTRIHDRRRATDQTALLSVQSCLVSQGRKFRSGRSFTARGTCRAAGSWREFSTSRIAWFVDSDRHGCAA